MEEAQGQAGPKISAIVLSYNNAPALRRCLAALEKSKPRETLEIIVADAGSVDESPRLDVEFPEVIFQRMPRNFGATKALNVGARNASGDYIFFVDPDIEVLPDTAVRLAARLEETQEAAAATPALITPDGQSATDIHVLPNPGILARAWHDADGLPAVTPDLSSGPVSIQYPGRAALMVRKFYLRGINYLDEKYGQYWSDADLCYQILRAGRKILLFPDIRATVHPDSAPGFSSAARGLLDADRVSGAERYASKYFGFFAGLKIRIGAALYALGQFFTFRDPGFQWARLVGILTGQKVDGTQTSL